MFYSFLQNNSGGRLMMSAESGIGEVVIIEASSADDANKRAVGIGLYFEGVKSGKDCPCCGNRWHRAQEQCGTTAPSVWGDDDDVIEEHRSQKIQPFENGPFSKGYIHYL